MQLTTEEIGKIATRTADEVMERMREQREERELRDHIIGGAMGEGAIPLYGRELRKEPCSCCLIDPDGPNMPENRICTTKGAIGTLKDSEEREWCSEINLVSDGRCARARSIREAARECKEKYPDDTAKFFECYAPSFSKITRGNSSTEYVTITDPGKTTFKVGEVVSREAFDRENERVKRLGEKLATGK